MSDDPVAKLLADPRFHGQPVTWSVTPDEYETIRRSWLIHVEAEERLFSPYSEPEWRTQMDTMLSVFSSNCVMEIVPTGERWEGTTGAEEFYRTFIPSFENMIWIPQSLVIGPQGVLDVVNMTGILRRPFAGLSAVGQQLDLQWVISFPWIPAEARFRGETVYSIRPLTALEQRAMTQSSI